MENRVLIALILSIIVIAVFSYLYNILFPPPNLPTSIKNATNKTTKNLKPISKSKEKIQFIKTNKIQLKSYFVETSYYNSTLISSGARFKNFKLKRYFVEENKREPIELVSSPQESLPLEIYLETDPEIAIINFNGPNVSKIVLNNSTSKTLKFWAKKENLYIEKEIVFKNDSYFMDYIIKLKNLGNNPIQDRLLIRGVFEPFSQGTRYTFKGPYYYTDHLNEVKLKDKINEYVGSLKYLGYQDVYFIVAVIPEVLTNATYRATFRKINQETQEFILWTPPFKLDPGQTFTYKFKLYMGPKKTEEMKKEYPLLTKALYFGIFDFVAKPLLYGLKFFNKFTHNYGWDIVILTVLLRLLFFPLNHFSYKSMKRMQELQPIFQRLREKYKDDPKTLNKELMDLYKRYKINPFSGCLPILIQIPVFIAFYKVLLMAIELRHAPFILWITDLSAPERLYIGNFHIPYLGGIPLLTILMGASMYLQQKLSPSVSDPFQAKIMNLMPIIFTILFINFPSGLVLYWFVNNILSIGQQYFTLKISK